MAKFVCLACHQEFSRDDSYRLHLTAKHPLLLQDDAFVGKNAKGKIVGWKDSNKDSEREKADKRSDAELNAETAAALTREIKKSEESLHNRLGRLISKELDKQRE